MKYTGTAVSPGVAIAPVYCYKPYVARVTEKHIGSECVAGELLKYNAAAQRALAELTALRERFSGKDDEDKAGIFGAHTDILTDEAIVEMVQQNIEDELCTASYAVERAFEYYAKLITRAKDALISERAADVHDVKNRLLRCMEGKTECTLSALPGPVIVAARDLLPSDTATLDRQNVLGIVTEIGGTTSHTAIIAKSYDIPAILGVPELLSALTDGEEAVLDAEKGELICGLSDAELDAYREERRRYLQEKAEISLYKSKPCFTADGVRIDVGLNIGSSKADDLLNEKYTDFVGLLRTEFLYMSKSRMPSEEEQLAAYKAVLQAYGSKPVTLRTLDIGGDKTLPYFELPKEGNPFLGKRALRLCLDNPELFVPQLRAALRASAYGKLWIMFPMVEGLDDFRRGKAVVEQVRAELLAEGVPMPNEVKLGIMIEIPSVAMIADVVARETDFASIGTNDLCQYLTATDRMNPYVSEYYQTYHPAMFRLLASTIDAFCKAGKPISVCGELGGDVLAAPVLVGMGMRKLSMNMSSVAAVKRRLSQLTLDDCRELAGRVCSLGTADEIKSCMLDFYAEKTGGK